MATTETLPARNHLLPTICLVGALAFILLFGMLSYGFTGYFRLGRDVKALRNSLMDSAAADWEAKIEINVGAFTLNLARTGLGFVDLKSEVRAALGALRSGEVGFYRLRHGHASLDHAAMLVAADAAMTGRGWDRLVGVMNRHELVAVYVPREVHSSRDVKFCLVVMSGRELIVAAARSNLEPLAELALSRAVPRLRIGSVGGKWGTGSDG